MSVRGFTLVELSIVLVIIGLIMGGILGGQELIRASELNSVLTDVNKYRVAMNTFKVKYNALPGDMKNAASYWPSATCANSVASNSNPTGCNGNGNGIVELTSTQAESFRFWNHLNLSGILPGNYTGVAGPVSYGDEVVGTNIPEAKITGMGVSIGSFGNVTTGNAFIYAADYGNNCIALAADSTAYGDGYGWIYREVLPPEDAANVDTKTDDGRPSKGKWRARPSSANPGCTTSDDANLAAYNLTNKAIACSFIVSN